MISKRNETRKNCRFRRSQLYNLYYRKLLDHAAAWIRCILSLASFCLATHQFCRSGRSIFPKPLRNFLKGEGNFLTKRVGQFFNTPPNFFEIFYNLSVVFRQLKHNYLVSSLKWVLRIIRQSLLI